MGARRRLLPGRQDRRVVLRRHHNQALGHQDRPPDPDLEGPQGAGALDRLLPRWPPAYQRRSRPHRQAVGRGRRPEARLDGSVSPLTTTVRTLRDPVALALLPESFAGQAEQLCSFGLVVPRPLQRLEDVLLLELLAG